MNAQEILNDIKKEKEIFFNQFNDDKALKKTFIHPILAAFSNKDISKYARINEDFWSLAIFALPAFLAFLSCITCIAFWGREFFKENIFIFPLFYVLFFMLLSLAPIIINKLELKFRKRSDLIESRLSHLFYNSEVKNEISNALKLYLNDAEYFKLRENNNKNITYQQAIDFLEARVNKENVLIEKRSICLTANEIEKYSKHLVQ